MSVSSPPLTELRSLLTGTLALPGEPGYELATPWNVAVPMTPAAVVAAHDANDVAATVRFANDHGLRVLPQRTGHGAVHMDLDDTLLVHTANLDELQVDPVNRRARIGAGVIWQQVLDATAPHGLAPLVGSAPGVGVVGFLTGGGIGPLTRTYGLASDTVLALEVITGDGRLLRATPTEHADLFWGLRGGKGTLGVVTAVELTLLPLAQVYGGALFFNGTDASGVLHMWREWTQDLPEHANTSIALLQLPDMPGVPAPLAGRLTVSVRFTSTATQIECEQLLAPMRAVADPIIDTLGLLPYAAIGAVHMDPTDPMPVYETSGLLRELAPETVDALLDAAGQGSGSPQFIVELRLMGGALAREPEHASAFCHRDAAYSLLVIGAAVPEIAELVASHNATVQSALAPWLTGGEFPNFGATTGVARMMRVYDEDTRMWLTGLAERHDPKGVLRVGQTVRV
ncbi:FAD-binding oxidoreductase [Solirubrobacter phytolaccae]|uniref:FAD-binding oxidoreductase n=1 Tax=Solirubrobacter phytolaccae TaxID=1404360 RepID=A0A9X3NFF3_9ACTN|nr:FAD-binding oxidoreductase [Solirubrobacter phytolaccae]MDA0185725.1 FAD-binding oxidoreductase [Solirubrobacter phytolaccae]